jgi:hypothetical protein
VNPGTTRKLAEQENPDGSRVELRMTSSGELRIFTDRGEGTAGTSAALPLAKLEAWLDIARDASLRYTPPEEASP